MSEAAAQYKKKDGTVSVAADGRTVSWAPTSGAPLAVSIVLAELISMLPSQKPQRTLT
jgi:transcription initiation factor TFIIH subunit 1